MIKSAAAGICGFYLALFSFYQIIVLPIVVCSRSDKPYSEWISAHKDIFPHLFDHVSYPGAGVIPMLNRKIFGGRRVSIREHPYVASIRRNVAHYSVGSIVTKNVIVTVAHPLVNVSIADLSVVVGENYADRGAILYTVILLIVHEDFDKYTLANDIALLRIFEDITYKGSAKSIPLIRASRSLEDRRAFVTGWGRCDRTGTELCLPRATRYTPGEKFDPMLRTISFIIRDKSHGCGMYIRSLLPLRPGMICVGTARYEDPMAECSAVPGAPLVVGAQLAGILSWGFGCSHTYDLPLVYTNTQFYRTWLVHNIKKLRSISKVYLLKLFQAKRAYILKQWLMLTRILPPNPFGGISQHLEPLRVDKELAMLSGHIYDIRDFLYNGMHHKYKQRLYKKFRGNSAGQPMHGNDVNEAFIRNESLRPFLKEYYYNQTNGGVDDDALIGDVAHIIDGDSDSNEEYGGEY